MTYKAAIFDLDGTLIDSIRDIGEAMNRTLSSRGYPTHAIAQYRYLIGDGVRLLIQRALPEHNRSDVEVDDVLLQYRADYGQHWHVHTRPYDGIPALLQELVEYNIPIGVLSNKPDGITKMCVDYFFPNTPFCCVAGQKEEVPRKPDPSAALTMADSMKVRPSECVFVGDTLTDMKTALAAGMFPAGVTWGFRDRRELQESGARLIACEPEALRGLFIPSPRMCAI